MLKNICQAFQASLPAHLTSIENALRNGDAPRLRDVAHKLCGMIGAFSTNAAMITSEIEDQAASCNLESCRPLVDQLLTIANQLLPQVDGISTETLQHRLTAADDPS